MTEINIREPGRLGEFFQLLALSAFALAQPLFGMLSSNSEFLIVHDAALLDIVLLVCLLVLAVPGLLFVLEQCAGMLGQNQRQFFHRVFLGFLFCITLIPPLDKLPALSGFGVVLVAIPGAVFAVIIYHRSPNFRRNLAMLALVVPIFVGLFLYSSEIRPFLTTSPFLVAGAEHSTVKSDTPIVVVILDAFPLSTILDKEGNIDSSLFPNFSRLAKMANWYPKATTVSGATERAVPAILTGRYAAWDQAADVTNHPRNLFTLFGNTHDMIVKEPATRLCPGEYLDEDKPTFVKRTARLSKDLLVLYQHFVYPKSLRTTLPAIGNRWKNFTTEGKPSKKRHTSKFNKFINYVNKIEASGKPKLVMIHSLLPHSPFRLYPDGTIYYWRESEPLVEKMWPDDPLIVKNSFRRHLLQVICVDGLVGKLLDRLEQEDLFSNAMLVVTSDHGSSFSPGKTARGFDATTPGSIMSVPLFVKLPGQTTGKTVNRYVQSVDVFPTIIDALNIKTDWEFDGVSFLDDSGEPRKEVSFIDQVLRERLVFPIENLNNVDSSGIWKNTVFGQVNTPDEVYYAGPKPDLIDRPITDFSQQSINNLYSILDHPQWYKNVKLHGNFVPGEITGVLSGWSGPQRANLAIAVNGLIKGLTSTYLPSHTGPNVGWSALLPKTALASGENFIEVFLVENQRGTPVLVRLSDPPPSLLGVCLGSKPTTFVDESGFYRSEKWSGIPVRWSNGHARLTIPLFGHERPDSLSIKLLSTGPGGTNLKIKINDQILLDRKVSGGRWQQTFPLNGLDFAGQAIVEIVSDSSSPHSRNPSFKDKRELGVAVAEVKLLPAQN